MAEASVRRAMAAGMSWRFASASASVRRALLTAKLVKGATLKVYPGAPHGLCSTMKDKVNADLLEFIKA